jgi:hypothetical protein
VSRNRVKWLKLYRQADKDLEKILPRKTKSEGKTRLWDPDKGQHHPFGIKPAQGREICTRPMSQAKEERVRRWTGGFALPVAIIACLIMSMVATVALKTASDEFLAARANRLGYVELIEDESAINWAFGAYRASMDSLVTLSEPGLPMELGRGVQLIRYSLDPEIVTVGSELVMLHTQQVVALRRGRVEVTLQGNPGMWLPGEAEDDPNPENDPNESAWKCVWPNEANCWNSPNFGAHWLDSSWQLAPRSWRQLW